MRAAGCIWNDLNDKDYDIRVERTKKRLIASGKVSKKKAILFMIFGAVLLITLQNIFLKPTFAKSDNLIIENQVSNNEKTVNFENAAEIAVKAVVHIKSKYLEDEMRRIKTGIKADAIIDRSKKTKNRRSPNE
mgnify:CR=1 FL=1